MRVKITDTLTNSIRRRHQVSLLKYVFVNIYTILLILIRIVFFSQLSFILK